MEFLTTAVQLGVSMTVRNVTRRSQLIVIRARLRHYCERRHWTESLRSLQSVSWLHVPPFMQPKD